MNKTTSRRIRSGATAAAVLLSATAAFAQVNGAVANGGCTSLINDNRGIGGELYVLKTHNPGTGPDGHQDWVFDLSAKGTGAQFPATDAGGGSWSFTDTFKHHIVPPEEVFVIETYPNGWVAIDSSHTRGTFENMGIVQRQHVGDSLPVGTDSGIGLVLPGSAMTYGAAIADRASGVPAVFPYGTSTGIEVAFSPVAEINNLDLSGSGCTIGGEILDENANFGLIVGYNVFRIEGVPTVVPTPADFVGHWQYYMPYDSFDMTLSDTPGAAGADINGDGMPDGDGTAAPNDRIPNDLVGLQNPDARPYSGDEVLIFQDSALNPDGTPRISGTGPDRMGRTGYWYAFQPVLFQGTTRLVDYDGLGFSQDDLFVGQHAIDTDGDTIPESLDVDLDGSRDFYSPQVVIGQNGLGLTNAGLPVLSSPIFGHINPLVALGDARVSGQVVGNDVHLTFMTGLELEGIQGYNIYRHVGIDSTGVRVNSQVILARGGDSNVYELLDRLAPIGRRVRIGQLAYSLRVVRSDGSAGPTFGPFSIDVPTTSISDRRHR